MSSCWENPETCHGCAYCVAGEDEYGQRYYDDTTPEQARRLELPPGEPMTTDKETSR